MGKIILDMALDAAMSSAPCDPEAAAEVLRLAVPYLRDLDARGELPSGLGRYLADAFTLTAREQVENRPQILARTLNLTVRSRPNLFKTGAAVEDAMQDNPSMSKYAAVKQVCRQTGVSVSFAKKAHKLYLACLEEIEQIEREEWRLQREEDERIETALQIEYYESRLEDAAKRVEVLLRDAKPIEEATYTAACELGLSPNDLKRFLEINPPTH